MAKILHICSNYIGTKIFPNMLYNLNRISGNHFLFCPINKKSDRRYSYLNLQDEIFDQNRRYATVSACFNTLDRLFFFSKRKKIRKTIQKNYDMHAFTTIMAHSLFTDGWVARELNRRNGVPYSVFVQNTDINFFFKKMKFLKKRALDILENAKKIVFCSPCVAEQFLKEIMPSTVKEKYEKKVLIIPFGIEDYFINNKSEKGKIINNETISILTVATIDTNKNQIAVAKAIELLRQKGYNLQYSLVGKVIDESYFQELKKFEFVHYLGVVTEYENLKAIYASADIFVLSSVFETFGLVYGEAMTQGLPLVYSKGQGFDGQFADGEVGYAIPCTDVEKIAHSIQTIIGTYAKLSQNAIALCEKFNWINVAQAYNAFLQVG